LSSSSSPSEEEDEEEEDARRTRTVPRLGLTRDDDEENEDVLKLLRLVAALRALVCARIFTSPRFFLKFWGKLF